MDWVDGWEDITSTEVAMRRTVVPPVPSQLATAPSLRSLSAPIHSQLQRASKTSCTPDGINNACTGKTMVQSSPFAIYTSPSLISCAPDVHLLTGSHLFFTLSQSTSKVFLKQNQKQIYGASTLDCSKRHLLPYFQINFTKE
jgi:hypothetical protein